MGIRFHAQEWSSPRRNNRSKFFCKERRNQPVRTILSNLFNISKIGNIKNLTDRIIRANPFRGVNTEYIDMSFDRFFPYFIVTLIGSEDRSFAFGLQTINYTSINRRRVGIKEHNIIFLIPHLHVIVNKSKLIFFPFFITARNFVPVELFNCPNTLLLFGFGKDFIKLIIHSIWSRSNNTLTTSTQCRCDRSPELFCNSGADECKLIAV